MIKVKEMSSYNGFEMCLKNLINELDSDIISLDISYSKESKNISFVLNRKEKLNIKL